MIFKRVSKQIYDSHQEPIRKPQLRNHVRGRERVSIQKREKILKQRVLITPEKFDENGAFRRKRSSNRKNLKTPALCFSEDGKHLKTELFENNVVKIIKTMKTFPCPSFEQTQSKMTAGYNAFKFIRRIVEGA